MRLMSFMAAERASFGAVRDEGIVDLGARARAGRSNAARRLQQARTLREVLAADALSAAMDLAGETAPDLGLDEVRFLPTIPDAGKIICIGINYGKRDAEYGDGTPPPKYPSVFFRIRESLVGHREPIVRPPESEQLDYEGEIALIIGKHGRRIPEADAWRHVAGLTLMNEGSVRDWLRHAKFNVTPGKNFERSGSLGPWMVSVDEIPEHAELCITTTVNGEVRQSDTTANLLFPFRRLIAYLSAFMPLGPGDVIATGTPTGAGARFDPPRYLVPGDVVEVRVAEIGALINTVEDEGA